MSGDTVQLGSVDVSRVTSRMSDSRYVNALNMLLLTLPGTPLVYYGDELGMKDVNLTVNYCNKLDPVSFYAYCLSRTALPPPSCMSSHPLPPPPSPLARLLQTYYGRG